MATLPVFAAFKNAVPDDWTSKSPVPCKSKIVFALPVLFNRKLKVVGWVMVVLCVNVPPNLTSDPTTFNPLEAVAKPVPVGDIKIQTVPSK